MSAYVVTPSGEVVEYPTAHFVRYSGTGTTPHSLWESEGGRWVASVPGDWAVSWVRPNALGTSTDAKALKRALRNYDARTGRWNT